MVDAIWGISLLIIIFPPLQVPEQIRLKTSPVNPAVPPRRALVPSRFRRPPGPYATTSRGTGSKRIYLDIQSLPPDVAFPPRPVPGSIADLDVIMEHCDFSEKKVYHLIYIIIQFTHGILIVCPGLSRSP